MLIIRSMLAGLVVAVSVALGPARASAHEPMLHADAGPALPPCTCRANGRDFQMGEVACLRTSQGARLARCIMVLNNTSWETIQQSCPSAKVNLTPRPRA